MSKPEFIVSHDHTMRVARCASNWLHEVELPLFEKLSLACESPIEHLMIAPLMCVARGGEIDTQVEIDRFRVDFLLQKAGKRIVVECDGRAFHHLSYEQFQRDKARTKRLQELGYLVMRFSGSEIHRDPFGCASRVKSMIDGEKADAKGPRGAAELLDL